MKIQAWILRTDGTEESITVDNHDSVLSEVSKKYFDGNTLDLTKVRFKGRLCHMAVDDEGYCKNLPRNEAATKAYLANCYPGTTHHIAGDAVVFGGLLP